MMMILILLIRFIYMFTIQMKQNTIIVTKDTKNWSGAR